MEAEFVPSGPSQRLNLTAPTRHLGPRRLIHEGPLSKPRSRKVFNCYLFNDLLVLSLPPPLAVVVVSGAGGVIRPPHEIIYRYPIPLEECYVKDGRDDTSFVVSHRGESIPLKAGTPRACLGWQKDIEGARKEALAALEAYRSKRGARETFTLETQLCADTMTLVFFQYPSPARGPRRNTFELAWRHPALGTSSFPVAICNDSLMQCKTLQYRNSFTFGIPFATPSRILDLLPLRTLLSLFLLTFPFHDLFLLETHYEENHHLFPSLHLLLLLL